MALTHADIKKVKLLHRKSEREATGVFLVEGHKCVMELLASPYHVNAIYATEEWHTANFHVLHDVADLCVVVGSAVLQRMTALTTASEVIAVANAQAPHLSAKQLSLQKLLLLDGVADPGNLGTIIRTADWFGIDHIVCSPTTCEWYNPKVVQAAMGSLFRVQMYRTVLPTFIEELKTYNITVISTAMGGNNVYEEQFPQYGALIIGSESHGVSDACMALADAKVHIPQMSLHGKVESLNAAVASAIVMSMWCKH